MKDRWNYAVLGQVTYGSLESYRQPIAWFDEVGGVLEDWGCGCAAAKAYVKKCKYIGIEGSKNDYADRCDVDLTSYTSSPDCLLLRDVIDHNPNWKQVLQNAVQSFQKRMVLVIFRDMGTETKVVFVNTDSRYPGVPDFQFRASDLLSFIKPYLVKLDKINHETLFYLEKKCA